MSNLEIELSSISGIGNRELLDRAPIGLLCSRECPGDSLLKTLDMVPRWVASGAVIVSGFHSPLEQQVARSLLRRDGRLIKVLGRCLDGYRCLPEEREAIRAGRMLVISTFEASVRSTTRKTALERNRLVVSISSSLYVPHIRDGSPLAEIVEISK